MSLRTQGTIPVLAVLFLMILASLSNTPAGGPDGPLSTAAGTRGPADEVGPMADTVAPVIKGIGLSPTAPGPLSVVSVTARIIDESNTTTQLFYGYDNSTWSGVTMGRSGHPTQTYAARIPASGYAYGTTLQGSYNPGALLTYLNVYTYSSDGDTIWVRVRGYVEATSTWEDIYYSTSTGSGYKVNGDVSSKGYKTWDITFYDTEQNDNIYYNYTYRAGRFTFTGSIPAAGSNPKVYYYLNATDDANNTRLSGVLNYTIDLTLPEIHNFSKPSSVRRDPVGIPIYANVSDGSGLDEVHLNVSLSGVGGHRTLVMTRVSGTATSGEYMVLLPAPPRNSTVSLVVGARDVGGNYNNTSAHGFTYDPPPRIENLTHLPHMPNHLTPVNVSADVTDLGGLSRVVIRYSTDNSTWTNATPGSAGSRYWSVLAANLGSPWVYYRVWAEDSGGGVNQSDLTRYYVDKLRPRIYTPYIVPQYANASSPVWAVANVTDDVGLASVRVLYSMDGGSTWGSASMGRTSDASSLTVAGHERSGTLAYFQGLPDVGSLLGTWDSGLSGYGGTPAAGLLTDVDVVMLDGSGQSWYGSEAIASATAGKLVVVTDSTWNSILVALGNPSYTSLVSRGFTTYGMPVGRGAIVTTYTLTNRNYMGWSYDGYSASVQADLAEHLRECHVTFMPHSGQIPASVTTKRVLYRINATDLSNLSTQTNSYEYTTDGALPWFNGALRPPSPAGWDQSRTFPVWANVSDESQLDRVVLHYSLNGGTTWATVTMTMASGNATTRNYTASIPATGTYTWVNYWYEVFDRANNSAREPSSTVLAYQTSDAPTITGVSNSPSVGGKTDPVTATATVRDPDTVAIVRVLYRYGTGTWSPVNATAGTNDRWDADIPSPGYTVTVSYRFEARDTVGVWATSSVYTYQVDGDPPVVTVGGYSPTNPSATAATTVNGSARDDASGMTTRVQYRYGQSGAVGNLTPSFLTRTSTDRNPDSGYTYGILSATYNLPSELLYLNVYTYSSDSDTLYVRVRGYRNSTSAWEDIYYASSTNTGTKVNRHWTSSGYGAFSVYVYDTEGNDATYYNITYRYLTNDLQASVPGPGYSTWVYYRVSATDAAGNTATTEWKRYWADGNGPTLDGFTLPATRTANEVVSVTASFSDDVAMDRAVLYYSYGGPYQSVAMTVKSSNTTHLTASAEVPVTYIPMTVDFYFVSYDKAGNSLQTSTYSFDTWMADVPEGAGIGYNAQRPYAAAGWKSYEWDFDYDGSTFNVDATKVNINHMFLDNGTFTVALRLTDNNDAVTLMTFIQNVTDKSPIAKFQATGYPNEGNDIVFNASVSSSYPDAIVKYEWDFDYDGITFDVDSTNVTWNRTFMDNGTYGIGLRVTDDDGSVNVTWRLMRIQDLSPKISVDFPQLVFEGDVVTFDARNTTSWPDALDRFEWYFGNIGATPNATGAVINHTFMDNGYYYYFHLLVYDEDGSYEQYNNWIVVQDRSPMANISAPRVVDEGTTLVLVGSNSTSYPDEIVSWEWDLDFSGVFTVDAETVNVTHVFMDDGDYRVALRVTDDDGSRHRVTWDITVRDLAPVATFDLPSVVDEGTTLQLNASASTSYPDEITRYEWDLSFNGSFTPRTAGMVVEWNFDSDGEYVIALRVTDDDGSTTVVTRTLEVLDLAPVIAYTLTGDLVEGSIIIFDARSSTSGPDGIVSYTWTFEDTGEPVDFNGSMVTHAFMDDGEHVVVLTLADKDGSVTSQRIHLNITDLGPTALLYPSGTSPEMMMEGDTLTLNATRRSRSYPDALVAFEWWWEADGAVELSPDNTTLSITFHSPGEHIIWLLVRDDDGSEDVTNLSVPVFDVGPIAVLQAEEVPEGTPLLLNASATYEPGMDLVLFRWDVDADNDWDAETDGPWFEHTWTVPATYVVRVMVVDEDGTADITSVDIVVTDVAPVADAGGPYRVDEGETLVLDGTGSYEPGDHIVDYRWDMDGDGEADVEGMYPEASWRWDVADVYRVGLWVKDAEGNVDVTFVNVTVDDLPPVFQWDLPDDLLEGRQETYALRGLADPGTQVFQVLWYFGDGNSLQGAEVNHTYWEQGEYSANVTVLDNDGILHIFELPVQVVANADPHLIIEWDRYTLTEDEPFVLQLQAEDTASDTLSFDFEGPGGSIDPDTGVFTWTPLDEHVGGNAFTFVVTDEDGGRDEVVVTLYVEDVDNDFLGGMSTSGGSALILLLVLAVIIVAVVYMRYRNSRPPVEGVDEEELEEEGDVLDLDLEEAFAEQPTAAAAPPPPADTGIPSLPDGPVGYAGASAASGEAASGDADQLPPPPPPPAMSGPAFNQLLEDRAAESELDGDDENEVDASEWEVID